MNQLKEIAKKKNIKQTTISRKTGIPTRTLNRYFNGDRLPDVVTAIKIAEALETTVEEIFCDSVKETKKEG